MISTVLQPLLRKAARNYIAGPALEDALRIARPHASTLCFWDGPAAQPRQVAGMYEEALRAIAREHLDSYISIKAPSLAFDPQLLLSLVHSAGGAGTLVHFDSLGLETAGRTLELIERLAAGGAALGCSVPGRWQRSPRDAERLARMGVRVRVVKGQWPNTGRDIEPRAGFLEVLDALAGTSARVAIATHDPVLAAQGIGRLQARGTPCELELLYGLPRAAALRVAREAQVPVRYYLPYGHAWLPYALRQAAGDPRILWRLLRDASRN